MTDKQKPESYYGPLFWLAVISFTVPLFVAAAVYRQHARLTTKPEPNPDVSGVDHALWDYLLKTYVENGLVDYDSMARDHLFRTYLKQLGQAQPAKLTTQEDALALLCNAYNAFVVNGVITHKIRDSVMNYELDGVEFFDQEEHILAGQTVSLNYIEHKLIRARYHEPRVHVALVCAARSCPAIRPEAYVGSRIAGQLEDQSSQFANDRKYVDFDPGQSQISLSPILNWYGDDWNPVGGYLPWLAERVKDTELKSALQRAARNEIDVTFFKYDWSLNTQGTSAASSSARAKPPTEFGSGSIPNR